MSPALLNKYLQAARSIADHAVFTADGIEFAPHPMRVTTDRQKYAIQQIMAFYHVAAAGLRQIFRSILALSPLAPPWAFRMLRWLPSPPR